MTWNIRHGGSEARLPGILSAIYAHKPDILVLTEFRQNAQVHLLRASLQERGYTTWIASGADEKTNGVLIASIYEALLQEDPACSVRLLPVFLPSLDLHLLALHIPGQGDGMDKRQCWDAVLDYASRHLDDRCLLLGDFNTGLTEDAEGTPFALPEKMQELQSLGYIDAWRTLHPEAREYSWYSTAKNGFRLDYLFLSPSLQQLLREATLSQEGRLQGLSDHASLIVTLAQERF